MSRCAQGAVIDEALDKLGGVEPASRGHFFMSAIWRRSAGQGSAGRRQLVAAGVRRSQRRGQDLVVGEDAGLILAERDHHRPVRW
jgi:hypothetical protein